MISPRKEVSNKARQLPRWSQLQNCAPARQRLRKGLFPRSRERGPVEETSGGAKTRVLSWLFPRSRERGPVEDSRHTTAGRNGCQEFPRSRERGPVEE